MVTVRVLGTSRCSDCTRAKDFLSGHGVDFEWIDIDVDATAASEVEAHNDGRRVVPTIFFDDGAVLVEPSDQQLADQLGLTT